MTQTKIFTTRKLEKVTKEFISENDKFENEFLGDWASTLFYVSNKKCWLSINKLTKYILILPNVKKTDLQNISSIFKENFHVQLAFDGIIIDFELIDKIIGEIKLYETNNDKSTSGFLTSNLLLIEHLNCKPEGFYNMNFRELNGRLNSTPIKILDWKYSKDKMAEMIKAIHAS